jgi:hypothetical protein
MKPIRSAIYASGSFGLLAPHGHLTMRVWFCGRETLDLNSPFTKPKPCAHSTRAEARECRKKCSR